VSSEAVHIVRNIIPGMGETTLRELRSLVAYSLAAPSSSELREQRLGLLVEMVAAAPAHIPLSDEYDTQRHERLAAGQTWPSRSQLSRAYGSWLRAVAAAIELEQPQRTAPAPSYQARPVAGHPYTREDAVRAIARCCEEIGHWPNQSDYLQWRRILRHMGRLYGPGEPRLPDPKALRRLYGNWLHASEAAQRWIEATDRPPQASPKSVP
jgi:hypothetical protein